MSHITFSLDPIPPFRLDLTAWALRRRPQNEVDFTGDDAAKMQKLLDALENLDDVQDVYTNAVIVEE